MRSAVTVSLVPEVRGGPFVFWDGLADACTRAAALGFDAVEIFPPTPEALDETARQVLGSQPLAVAAVGTGAGWVRHRLTLTHPDAQQRRQAVTFVRRIIDAAAALRAPAIIGSMQGRWEGAVTRPQALQWLGEALDELGEHAAGHGVPLLYEPLNRYETNLFNRLGETATWLGSLRTRNVRILGDLFHLNIEEPDIAQGLRDAGPLLGHVHFADSNRRAVGFGHTAIPPVMRALRDLGYTGYLSAEVLAWPDPAGAAAQTIQAFRAALAAS